MSATAGSLPCVKARYWLGKGAPDSILWSYDVKMSVLHKKREIKRDNIA
jgi:hypothetical protein